MIFPNLLSIIILSWMIVLSHSKLMLCIHLIDSLSRHAQSFRDPNIKTYLQTSSQFQQHFNCAQIRYFILKPSVLFITLMSSKKDSDSEDGTLSDLEVELIPSVPSSNDENMDLNSPTKPHSKGRKSIDFQPSNTSPLKVHSARCKRSKQQKTKKHRKSESIDQNQNLLLPKHCRSKSVSNTRTKTQRRSKPRNSSKSPSSTTRQRRNNGNYDDKDQQKIQRIIREKNEYRKKLNKFEKENQRLNNTENHLKYKMKILIDKIKNKDDEINDNSTDKGYDDDIFVMIDKLISNSTLNEEKEEKLLRQINELKIENQALQKKYKDSEKERKLIESKGYELEEKLLREKQIAMSHEIEIKQKPQSVKFSFSVFL